MKTFGLLCAIQGHQVHWKVLFKKIMLWLLHINDIVDLIKSFLTQIVFSHLTNDDMSPIAGRDLVRSSLIPDVESTQILGVDENNLYTIYS